MQNTRLYKKKNKTRVRKKILEEWIFFFLMEQPSQAQKRKLTRAKEMDCSAKMRAC